MQQHGDDVNRRLARRLAPVYVAATLQSFGLWYAVEKPFQASLGLTQTQMAAIAVVLNVLLATFNVPLGVLSDRWSRKGVLMAAGVMSATASVIGAVSGSFVMYLGAMSCYALFRAAYSGGYDSVVYDTVIEELPDDSSFRHLYGRVKMYEGIALAVSSLLGGIVASVLSLRAAYILTAPFAVGSVVALSFFRGPTHRRLAFAESKRVALMPVLRSLLSRPDTRWIIAASVVVAIVQALMSYLDQLWMLALHLSIPLYGPVNALLLAGVAVGGRLATRRAGGTSKVTGETYVAMALVLICAGLFVHSALVVAISQSAILCGATWLIIAFSSQLHAATTSQVRSAVSSAVSTAGTISFVPVALLFGWISDTVGVFRAAWIPVALCALLLSFVLALRRSISSIGSPQSG